MRFYRTATLVLFLTLLLLPAAHASKSMDETPRLNSTLHYTGTVTNLSDNSTIAFNLTVKITYFEYEHDAGLISYNATYTIEKQDSNYTNTISTSVPAYNFITVPGPNYENIPVAIYLELLPQHQRHLRYAIFLDNAIVDQHVNGNLLTIYYTYSLTGETYQNSTVDLSSGVVTHYEYRNSQEYLVLSIVDYSTGSAMMESSPLSGTYGWTIALKSEVIPLVISLRENYTLHDMRMMEFNYYVQRNSTLIHATFVIGVTDDSDFVLPRVWTNPHKDLMEESHAHVELPDGKIVSVEYGYFFYMPSSNYVGRLDNGVAVVSYIPNVETSFLSYMGDGFPAMSRAYIENGTVHINNRSPARVVAYNENGVVLNETIDVGEFSVDNLTAVRVYNSTGGMFFYVPYDHEKPSAQLNVTSQTRLLVRDDEPILHCTLYENNNKVYSGYIQAFYPIYFDASGSISAVIKDLSGNTIEVGNTTTENEIEFTYSYVTNGTTLYINGTISGDSPRFLVQIYVDNILKINDTVDDHFAYSIDLSPGTHNITIKIYDAYGNYNTTTFSVTIEENPGETNSNAGSTESIFSPITIGAMSIIAVMLVLVLYMMRRK